MNGKDNKIISISDLPIEGQKNSGDISNTDIFIKTQQGFIDHKKSSIYFQKSFSNLIPFSERKELIELRSKPSTSLNFSPLLSSINLKLYNDNSFPIIFKLKTTHPDMIASQPARGWIQANSFIECHLTSIAMNYQMLLFVQYAQISNEYDDYITQWKKLKSDRINIKKLQCNFQNQQRISNKETLLKPVLFIFATVTLLTTLIYLRNK